MRKKIGSILCVAMAVSMLLSPMTVLADDLEEYPKTTKVNEKEGFRTPSGVTAKEFEERCDEEFESALGKSMAGGAIAVVSHGKVVFSKGYGYADMEKKIPFSPNDTVFEYGSVSKLFTWTCAMQMYEQGKLDLNKDIDSYLLDDFQRVNDRNKPVTMLQLMNHQAGYSDYLIHLFSREENLLSLREGLEEHKVSQTYNPGFASCYSNYGAALAGYVIENIMGEPFYQYAEDYIFEPLDMTQTQMNPRLEDRLKEHKSKAYVTGKDGLTEGDWTYVSMYPAGGMNGTLEDLTKFAQAYLEKDSVLFNKEDTFTEMLSSSYEIAPGVEGIAHGFIEFDGEYPTFWHDGETENFSTFFAIAPEAEFAIVACGNTKDAISTIEPLCFSMLEKQTVVPEEPEANLPDIEILEGDYQNFREVHHGILQILSLFRQPVHVAVTGENKICVDEEEYIQIAPYVFQSVETGRKCGFLVEGGKVVKLSQMLDYLPVSWTVSVRNIATYGVFFLFLIVSVVTWIRFVIDLIQKRRNSMHKYFLIENGILAVMIGILLVVVDKIISLCTISDFVAYQVGNCILAFLLFFLDFYGMISTRREKEKGIWLYRIHSFAILLLLCFAAGWGLFSVTG